MVQFIWCSIGFCAFIATSYFRLESFLLWFCWRCFQVLWAGNLHFLLFQLVLDLEFLLSLSGAYLFCPWPASGHLVGQWPWLQQMSCGAFWLWGLQRDMHTGDFLPWLQLSFWMPLNCGIFRGTEKLLICCPDCRRSTRRHSDCWFFRGIVKVLPYL